LRSKSIAQKRLDSSMPTLYCGVGQNAGVVRVGLFYFGATVSLEKYIYVAKLTKTFYITYPNV